MKPEKILYAMNDIDIEFLNEAREEAAPARRHSRKFVALIAAVIALMAVTATAFAAEEIVGWFRQYYSNQTDAPLTPGQIEFIEENEQIIAETQSHNGYNLELKSVMADSNTIYAVVGITAPAGTSEEDLRSLWGSDIDVYDNSGKPVGNWGAKLHIGTDGAESTADLVFEITPADWNSGTQWTLRISALGKLVHNREYEQELLDTKYAGQENIMFTDEEAAKIHQQVILAEGPWEFIVDLSDATCEMLELITTPITTQSCYGYKPDGTEVYEDVLITSFKLSALSAIIKAESSHGAALEFSNNSDRLIYVVMKDGSKIQLSTNWGRIGEVHMSAASPIVLDEVDHVLLADGTKLMVP